MLASVPDGIWLRAMLCQQQAGVKGIPVACEVDIYGALSEYIGACVTQDAVTLLDINNSVPEDLFEQDIKGSMIIP